MWSFAVRINVIALVFSMNVFSMELSLLSDLPHKEMPSPVAYTKVKNKKLFIEPLQNQEKLYFSPELKNGGTYFITLECESDKSLYAITKSELDETFLADCIGDGSSSSIVNAPIIIKAKRNALDLFFDKATVVDSLSFVDKKSLLKIFNYFAQSDNKRINMKELAEYLLYNKNKGLGKQTRTIIDNEVRCIQENDIRTLTSSFLKKKHILINSKTTNTLIGMSEKLAQKFSSKDISLLKLENIQECFINRKNNTIQKLVQLPALTIMIIKNNHIKIIPQGTFITPCAGCTIQWINNKTTSIEKGAFNFWNKGTVRFIDNPLDQESQTIVLKDTQKPFDAAPKDRHTQVIFEMSEQQ